MTMWLTALLCMGMSVWAADADANEVEREAYRQARDRFQSRMSEIHQDTVDYVREREVEERERVAEGFEGVLQVLEGVQVSSREAAADQFHRFLDKYPAEKQSSHIRFLLADLFFEESSERFLTESEVYYTKLESDDLELLESLGEEPKLDLSNSIMLYQTIVDDNLALPPEDRYERLDGALLMLGFCYSDETSAQRDEMAARKVFHQLIDEMPESDLADRSHLFLGNYSFADSDYAAAIDQYSKVMEKGEESPYFNEAIYQLAWARYKLSGYDAALTLFTRLLDLSVESKRASGEDLPYAPDAVRFMAFSFADIAGDDGREAVTVANEFFARVKDRPYEREVYIELADVLLRYTRPDEAILVYRKLQDDPRWSHLPDNPDHLMAVVTLYSTNFLVRDLEKSGAERLKLTEQYAEGSPWWEANRNNPDALSTAIGYMESSLLGVANEYFVRAQESGDVQDYALAASKYGEYLQKFPISDDYFEQQWFYATALRQSSQWEGASREYASLIRDGRYHSYLDGAVYSITDVRLQRMLQSSGAPDQAPVSAEVMSSYSPTPGAQIEVYALSSDRLEFIEAVDELLVHPFGEASDPDQPDYRQAFEQNQAALKYLPGQILYYHNNFEDARDRFFDLIDAHPRSAEASFAATLVLDSYIAEGDLESVRRWSKAFATRVLGTAGTPNPYFADQLEGSSFKLATQLADAEQLEEAAEAFLAFRKEFPNSEYAGDALHNAAVYLQAVGRVEQANQLYESFVAMYPDDEKSRILYFKIAANYEATFDLERAVDFYDRLGTFFPDDVNAADALFNASYLRLGMKLYAEAAQGFEQYGRSYEERSDREKTFFLAGEAWEQVGPRQATNFYREYLGMFGNSEPDHALEAESKLADLALQTGDTRAYEAQLDAILRRFDAIRASGETVGPVGQKVAAASAFRALAAAFVDLTDEQLSRDEEQDGELLQDIKPEEIRVFGQQVDVFVARFGDFTHLSKALYLKAQSLLYLADLGLSLEPPEGLTEEQQWAYLDVLEEQVFPTYYAYEDQGVERLVDVLAFAERNKRYSEVIDQAQQELNRRKPEEYPDVKQDRIARPNAQNLVLPKPRVPTKKAAGSASDTPGDSSSQEQRP
jgi:TolA-binding protein